MQKLLLLLTLILILIGWAFGFGILNYTIEVIPPDTVTYIDAANLLYQSNIPHSTRPLGYALLSGIPLIVSSSLSQEVLLIWNIAINAVLWLGSAVLLFKILKNYISSKLSFLLTILISTSLGILCHVLQFLTEISILFMLCLIAFYLQKFLNKLQNKFLLYVLSIFIFAILIKPGFLYLSAFFGSLIFIYILKKERKLLYSSESLYLWISVIAVFIQIFSIHHTYGNYKVSYIDADTWYYYIGSEVEADLQGVDYKSVAEVRRQQLSYLPMQYHAEVAQQDMKSVITEHKLELCSNWISNIFENINSGSSILQELEWKASNPTQQVVYKYLHQISRIQNILMMIILILSILHIYIKRNAQQIFPFVLAIISIYIIFTSGISFYQGDRFHIILYPIIIITAISSFIPKQKNVS